jgi:hypothetical protein
MSLTTVERAKESGDIAPPLDPAGWVSLAAGLLVILITFFSSCCHIDLFGFLHFEANQQIGIPLLLAALAALVGEVELASNSRRPDQRARVAEASARAREANEADRERYRAARRARIQTRFLVAQCRFLLSDTARNRMQPKATYACTIKRRFVGWPSYDHVLHARAPQRSIGRKLVTAGPGGLGLASGGLPDHSDYFFHLLQPCRSLRNPAVQS